MNKLLLFGSSVALLHPLALAQNPEETGNRNTDIYKSVVRIESATQVADYRTPWNSGRFGGGTGSGFMIGPNQFLTNAHVVSNANRVLITRRDSAKKHAARVVHIAHDCSRDWLSGRWRSHFGDPRGGFAH